MGDGGPVEEEVRGGQHDCTSDRHLGPSGVCCKFNIWIRIYIRVAYYIRPTICSVYVATLVIYNIISSTKITI